MVLNLEHILGSKNAVAVLRLLVLRPNRSFGLSELALIVKVSKSNVLRVLGPLVEAKLVIRERGGKKLLLRGNPHHRMNKAFFELVSAEKQAALPAKLKNAIDLFYEKVKERVQVFIVFGSASQGLWKEGSDIDLLVAGSDEIAGPRVEAGLRFEVQNYSLTDLERPSDFVVLEALLHGIVYKGELLELVASINSFPKAYLIYRLNKVKEF